MSGSHVQRADARVDDVERATTEGLDGVEHIGAHELSTVD